MKLATVHQAILSLAPTPPLQRRCSHLHLLPNQELPSWLLTRRHVHVHGTLSLMANSRRRGESDSDGGGRLHRPVGDGTPPNPDSLLSRDHLEASARELATWFDGKSNVLCLTGAGISTESGIPDYRGHGGSYRKGHKPMVHDQFINSSAARQRYWGRAMAGWRDFANADPNEGHIALTQLETMGKIGVTFTDSVSYYDPTKDINGASSQTKTGQARKMSILTQNVDGLHRKAATNNVTELHGRNDLVRCLKCGSYRSRYDFHDELESLNPTWIPSSTTATPSSQLRPDGDASTLHTDYSTLTIPTCHVCRSGVMKPDVVFFGDVVPRHRVERCYGAVRAADGLLCVGSSLAVHSAFRFVKAAEEAGVDVLILNVGDTRPEVAGVEVTKVEAPAGPTLRELVRLFERM